MAYKIQNRKQSKSSAKCSLSSVSLSFLLVIFVGLFATLGYIYKKYAELKSKKKAESSSWTNYIQSQILNDEEPSIPIQLLDVIRDDLLCLTELFIDQTSSIKTKTEHFILSSDLIHLLGPSLFICFTIFFLIKLFNLSRRILLRSKAKRLKVSKTECINSSDQQKLNNNHSDRDLTVAYGKDSRTIFVDNREPTSNFSRFCVLGFVLFFISLPWEYVRLYQIEVAKRMAMIQQGAPAECIPQSMNLYQSLKYWIQWHFSWQIDPCEQYHRALVVDPLWEVPPMMVLSTAVSRCILHPLELLCGGVGRSLRMFFSEIPVQWQPLLMLSVVLIIVLILVMSCRYRISFPLLIRIEPRTPVTSHSKQRSEQTNCAPQSDGGCQEPLKSRLTY